jgi:hypothetical protein
LRYFWLSFDLISRVSQLYDSVPYFNAQFPVFRAEFLSLFANPRFFGLSFYLHFPIPVLSADISLYQLFYGFIGRFSTFISQNPTIFSRFPLFGRLPIYQQPPDFINNSIISMNYNLLANS